MTVVSLSETDGLDVCPEAAPDRERQRLTRPDAALALVADGRVEATAALWWREPVVVPDRPGVVAGRIGHAAWADAKAGAALLAACVERLKGEGATLALGPLEGSTWFSYRVVTEVGEAPPFALEPWARPVIATAFEQVGFAPVAHYLSSRVEDLPDLSDRVEADRQSLAERGITLRRIDGEADVAALHPLLLRAFAGNPFYAPLDRDRFLTLYGPLLASVDPDLVLIAEAEGRPVGVMLAMPDLAQAARGEPVDTVVVKTLAVDPDWQGVGLGGALATVVQEAARQKGYRRAIHALMHADNASTRISRHLGRPFRRYALLGREL